MDRKFTSNAFLVADVQKTDTSANTTYFSLVSRCSISITFLIAALNDLDILLATSGIPTLMRSVVRSYGHYQGKNLVHQMGDKS